jgi:hypothetical protein
MAGFLKGSAGYGAQGHPRGDRGFCGKKTRNSTVDFTELRPAPSPEHYVGLPVPFLLSSLRITIRSLPTNIRTRFDRPERPLLRCTNAATRRLPR